MFYTNYIFGGDGSEIDGLCLEHVNETMLMFVRGYKDYWNDMKACGERITFGTYLKDVCPKRITNGKERVNLYKSLICLLEGEEMKELTIEQEYVLFHILDDYLLRAGEYDEEVIVPYHYDREVAFENSKKHLVMNLFVAKMLYILIFGLSKMITKEILLSKV